MELAKSVVMPIRQVAPRTSLRGLQEDYGHTTADVILLEGEIHSRRKPVSIIIRADKRYLPHRIFKGSLRFTSIDNRDMFSRLVLHEVHPPSKVYELARILVARLKMRTDGRMWLGAHMRRGDCTYCNQPNITFSSSLISHTMYSR